ncbi:calcium/sodium antiporter [Patescibacteria group bacterium]|nr:calcium/sodium antiporter [Patescibacteria group bacterium]
MPVTILLLIVGFALLIKGADVLIEGSASIAKRFGVSPLIIGITIVGFGTSTPELITSVIAALQNESALVLGNVIGSNIANVALILGITSLIAPLAVTNLTIIRELPFTIASSVAMIILIFDRLFADGENFFSRGDGMIMMLFFFIFIYFTVTSIIAERKKNKRIKKQVKEIAAEVSAPPVGSIGRSIGFVIVGLAGVMGGGYLVVNSAVEIATAFELSKTFIGLTIIAVGTSLPELVTSAVAAFKKETDLAVGNIVGSNIFNLLFVLSLSGILAPFKIDPNTIVDAGIMTVIMIFLFVFALTRKVITRWEGGVFFALYVLTMGFVIIREVNGFDFLI